MAVGEGPWAEVLVTAVDTTYFQEAVAAVHWLPDSCWGSVYGYGFVT